MAAIVTAGVDLAKNDFAVHGVNATGKPALVRPSVARAKLLELIAGLPPCLIGMQACWIRRRFEGAVGWLGICYIFNSYLRNVDGVWRSFSCMSRNCSAPLNYQTQIGEALTLALSQGGEGKKGARLYTLSLWERAGVRASGAQGEE